MAKANRPEPLPDVVPKGTRFDWGGRRGVFETDGHRMSGPWGFAYQATVGTLEPFNRMTGEQATVLASQIDWSSFPPAADMALIQKMQPEIERARPDHGVPSGAINLRCEFCGNAMRVERLEIDPPRAVECVSNECNICNHASGGFGEAWYFDAEGQEVSRDER